jgi:choline dehydrogenase
MTGVDVIVVGGGAAGCVVAARLAESGSPSVLLLEAGPDRRAEMPAALRDGWTIERESFEWGYVSAGEPPKPVRRKRVIGGTSWLTRFTPRGHPADFDGSAARGLDGWGWEGVLPCRAASDEKRQEDDGCCGRASHARVIRQISGRR